MSAQTFLLKVVHPFMVAGKMVVSGDLVEMFESEARVMLDRGRAVLATVEEDTKKLAASARKKAAAALQGDEE